MDIIPKLYPILVVQSRYGGVYEGGKWHALPKADAAWAWSDAYTEYMFGDDDAALEFWMSDEAKRVGRGGTPNSAVLDLVDRHQDMRQLEYVNELREAETKEGSRADNVEAGSETSGLLP